MEPDPRYTIAIIATIATSCQMDDICPAALEYSWVEVKLNGIRTGELWNGTQQSVFSIGSWS